jgi:hypothetical protein
VLKHWQIFFDFNTLIVEQAKHIIQLSLSGRLSPSSWTTMALLAIVPLVADMDDEYIVICSKLHQTIIQNSRS